MKKLEDFLKMINNPSIILAAHTINRWKNKCIYKINKIKKSMSLKMDI